MTRFFFLLSIALATLLAILLGAMNPQHAEVELAFLRFAAPIGVTLVAAFVIGLVAGLLWRGYWVAELLAERGRLRRALRLAESQARAAASRNAG
jgi:uncharacterized integral membrane protein